MAVSTLVRQDYENEIALMRKEIAAMETGSAQMIHKTSSGEEDVTLLVTERYKKAIALLEAAIAKRDDRA